MADSPVWMGNWSLDDDGWIIGLDGMFLRAELSPAYLGPSRVQETVRLAAAAPALARALLMVEWGNAEAILDGADGPQCCFCGVTATPGHLLPCPVDDALTAAGFSDAASRDAARERMRVK